MTTQRSTRRGTTPATEPASRNVIVDLDHTIADAYWRDALIGRWDEYYAESINDHPFPWIRDLLMVIHYTGLYNIVCITARQEKWRALSIKWMMKEYIPVDELIMRADDDYRKGVEVKESLIRERFPDLGWVSFAIEDRADVCEVYLRLGINVLQVHRGAPSDADGGRPALPSLDPRPTARDTRKPRVRTDPRRRGPGRQHRLA